MAQIQSLKQLILDIDDKKIFLPEFQSNFVWEISKTYDLFDSLVKDIFVGGIIYGMPPSSNYIRYQELWKDIWKHLEFRELEKEWYK
ncbi:MAG: hypothetical protein IPN10_18010 [Saprospiraceae bacterium]|nr:hypothetical protein [Saprospiraceae bacterium]